MKIKLTAAQRKAGVDFRGESTSSRAKSQEFTLSPCDVIRVGGKVVKRNDFQFGSKRNDFQLGAIAAANVADGYNSTSSHPYRLGDCILAKMNIGKRKPRANEQRQRSDGVAWLNGFAVALADMHRRLLNGNDGTSICAVARAAGLTLKAARSAGVTTFDLKELKKAGLR